MIILNIKGGLGNQLFQFIAALNFAKDNNQKLHIYTGNLSSYETKRKFALDILVKDYPLEIKLINKKKIFLNRFFLAFLGKIKYFVINEKNYFSKKYPFLNIIDDYFINSKYIDDNVLKSLNEAFDQKLYDVLASKVPQYLFQNSIGIHIRGTDRASENLTFDYERLLNFIIEESDSNIICFTDDIEYAKKQLNNITRPITFLPDLKLTDIEEFYFISKINKFIVSNSTFSILARRLSSNNTSTYVIKDFFAQRDSDLLDIFNFESNIHYI